MKSITLRMNQITWNENEQGQEEFIFYYVNPECEVESAEYFSILHDSSFFETIQEAQKASENHWVNCPRCHRIPKIMRVTFQEI